MARRDFRGRTVVITGGAGGIGRALARSFGAAEAKIAIVDLSGSPLVQTREELDALGIELPFTTATVIMAQMFVSAPFYIRAAKSGFASVDLRLEHISTTLGENDFGTFWRITLPMAHNALLAGAIMT